jgi:hypothetical protein
MCALREDVIAIGGADFEPKLNGAHVQRWRPIKIAAGDTLEFKTALSSKIVGQEEGVQALVDLYQVFCAGLNSPGRPVPLSSAIHSHNSVLTGRSQGRRKRWSAT